jgi:lipoprotein-anchoring transpeptidase ErfK/SrfK
MMVDYVQIISRAVAALDPNTRERREAIYGRARRALDDRFRDSDPPFPEAAWKAESAALEAAISRVESDLVRRAAPPPPDPAYETYEGAADVYADRPPLGGSRARAGMIAGSIVVLAALLAGVMTYVFWPDIRTTARSTLRSPVATPIAQKTDDRSYIYMRQLVYYRTNHPVGTLVVDKPQSFLYVVRPQLSAMRYTISVGNACAELVGLYRVVGKEEWPGWKAPPEPATADDRSGNPLGPRALKLTGEHLIHGSNAARISGQEALRRCIGLINDDVIDLYDRTPVGSRVVVLSPKIESAIASR